MLARMAAVDEQIGHRLHAVEAHEEALGGPLLGDVEVLLVVARGAQERALGQRIGVPAVGQGHVARPVGGVLRLEEEAPPLVQGVDLAGRGRHGGGSQQQKQKVSFHSVNR